jgi:hypothetical protein
MLKWQQCPAILVAAILLTLTSCSLSPQISGEELRLVVQRDGVPFQLESIPDELLGRLASHRVVLVGEVHFLLEHRTLVVELLRELHQRGFRQYLFEWTQATDWLLADYVNDGGMAPGWEPPHDIGGQILSAVRDLNRTLPIDEHMQVYGIDLQLPENGGAENWLGFVESLVNLLDDPGPLATFLQASHDTVQSHNEQLEALEDALKDRRSELIDSWGEVLYGTVVEMVEVELISITYRQLRESDDDRAARLREETIKLLVERRINGNPHGTLINIGSTHAQKESLWGTSRTEWLGDYLVHGSPAAGGSVIVVLVSAAHIVSIPGSGIPDYDLSASPPNELLRAIHEVWPDRIVFLPADDPVFARSRIPINTEGHIYIGSLKRHFDAFILLPLAHRDFIGD